MLSLQRGDQTVGLDTVGGRAVSYAVAGKEVIASEPHSFTSTYRSALLVPWPNRVAHGLWSWEREELRLPVNERPPGNALHGLAAFAPFQLVDLAEDRARLVHELTPSPGYPFPLRIEASYALRDEGLACRLEAVATGSRRTPVALGVHPYVETRGPVDRVTLRVPAEQLVKVDERWEEVDRVDVSGTALDLREGRRIGTEEVDACWTALQRDADGRVRTRVVLPGGDEVVVWGGPTARCIVVYTAHTLPGNLYRRSLAVEPATAPANALRSGSDLDVLEPGDRLSLDWGISASWLAC